MTPRNRTICLVVLGLFILGWAVSFAATTIPLRGRFVGTLERTTLVPGQSWSVEVEGTGQVTHMGRVTYWLGNDQIDWTGRGLAPGVPTGNGLIDDGRGNQVFGSYTWAGFATSDPNVFGFTGTFTVTGGTGKFTGASGVGVLKGTGNIATNVVEASIDGFLNK